MPNKLSKEAVEAGLDNGWPRPIEASADLRDTRRELVRMILRAALPIEEEAWLEKCQELLLAEETRELAGKAAYLDFEPDGDWDSLPENLRMTWEGNTAAGIEAALKSILGGNDV